MWKSQFFLTIYKFGIFPLCLFGDKTKQNKTKHDPK